MKRVTTMLAVLAAASSTALADGRLEGRIGRTDSNVLLSGAVVRIPGLGLETTTGSDGRYLFSQVPAGEHRVSVNYLGFAPRSVTVAIIDGGNAMANVELGSTVEEIVVYGRQTASAASALNQQRAADGIRSLVSATDIGALPDQNAAEALSRVPGTYLERDQGEGRYVGIRGIDPNLNTTSINGLRIPAPEGDQRAIQLDVVPSELLATLEVAKSMTPDMDGDAIGGNIDIDSISAFGRRDRDMSISAEGTYSDLTGETSPRVSGHFSDIFDFAGVEDSLGVAAAISYHDRDFSSANVENGDGWPDDRERLDGTRFRAAEELEQRSYVINRDRFGAALNFDFRPGDTSEYYLRTLYSEASDQEYRLANVFALEDDEADNGGARDDSTVETATWDNAALEKELKDRDEEASILSVALGGSNALDIWSVDYQIGYSMAEQDTPTDRTLLFVGDGFTLGYDGIGEEIGVFADDVAADADNYALDEVSLASSLTRDQEWSYRLDVTRDLSDIGYPGTVQVGAKARLREKSADADETFYDGFSEDVLLSDGLATPVEDYDLRAPFVGPGISPGAAERYVAANRDAFEIDDEETLIASVGDDYTVNEDVYATYAMTRADVGRLRVVAGLRYEHTALDASGTAIVLDGVFHKSIDDVIVRANVADDFDLTPFIGTVIVDDAAIIQPINGEDASILGAAARAVRRTADIEGVALRQSDTGALLVVSSQGDNSYAVYDTASRQHLVSFHVGGAGGPDDVSETDGLDVTAASLPGFPEGLLVVQDGYKPEANQNFKFVSWRDIATLLRPGTAAGGSPGSAL